jgi:hypothetical protein
VKLQNSPYIFTQFHDIFHVSFQTKGFSGVYLMLSYLRFEFMNTMVIGVLSETKKIVSYYVIIGLVS